MRERKLPEVHRVGRVGKAVDRVIAELFPKWSIKRAKLRKEQIVAHMQSDLAHIRAEAFEAAAHDRLRSERWLGSKLNADSTLLHDLETLRTRSRELFRNDDYFHGAVEKALTNTVGTDLRPQAMIKAPDISEAKAEAIGTTLEDLWRE